MQGNLRQQLTGICLNFTQLRGLAVAANISMNARIDHLYRPGRVFAVRAADGVQGQVTVLLQPCDEVAAAFHQPGRFGQLQAVGRPPQMPGG
ncbi:hypothetical protein D3C78_1602260 [compost metagenome]